MYFRRNFLINAVNRAFPLELALPQGYNTLGNKAKYKGQITSIFGKDKPPKAAGFSDVTCNQSSSNNA